MRTTGNLICIMLSAVFALSCSNVKKENGNGNVNGSEKENEMITFYVGSSDRTLEYSIFLCELDPKTGEFAVIDSFSGAESPSYLALSPGRDVIYAINDVVFDEDKNQNSVSAFRIQEKDLKLKFLNSQSSEGSGPCHVHCSEDGKHIFVANYSSGHASAYSIASDGSIGLATSVVIGEGSGPVENRQKGPHAHQVMLDPNNNYLLVPDLGTDKVMIYEFDKETGTLKPNPNQPFFKMRPGAGPRHLVFNQLGDVVFIVNELDATVTSCLYDEEYGTLGIRRTVNTVSESHVGSKYPAAIRAHPNGKYIYATTRGENSCISVFELGFDGDFFRTQVVYDVPVWPREFNLDPSGKFLLIAGERSDEIALYRIDGETGKLTYANSKLVLPSPASILYLD